ncbi:MAG: hypothetical protein RIE59_00980 [Imperialibacter sp.]
MKAKLLFTFLSILICQKLAAQVYLEKQTRHRFAQMNLGLDYQTNFGGKTAYIDADGNRKSLALGQLHKPRFLIGGTHFWGHADFYIAIPLYSPTFKKENQVVNYLSGVETVFKYYPLKIESQKIRPFIGTSVAAFYFEQNNNNLEFGNGPELNHTSLPLLAGLTFDHKSHLFEAGVLWNYANKQDYYISKTDIANIRTPPLYLTLSYRLMFDTTISAEKSWESGRTDEVTQLLADKKRLNSFYIGAGLSSAFWMSKSSYNAVNRPYLPKYNTSIMPDFSLGYYMHQPDMNIALTYRGYGTSTNTYGTIQVLHRESAGLEATKFLFDYHGFVPFVGPVLTYEQLSFDESFENQRTAGVSENKLGYGITFGWDIRPNRIQTWLLRTNLRWFPKLDLPIDNGQSISFNGIEFNFIQLVVYPGRMMKR